MTTQPSSEDEIHPSPTNQTPNGNVQKPISSCAKIRIVFSNITVEPVLVLFLLPSIMSVIAIANLDLEKACRVNLQLNETICDGLASRNSSMYNSTDEIAVQKLVATMNAWKSVIKSVLPAILLLLMGSWSDRHQRRKPCMLLPLVGEVITCIGFLLCTYFFYQLPMQVTGVVETVPTALTGGWFAMLMAVFSYVSGITSVEMRTIRLGALNIVNHLSFTVGIALSGVLYNTIGLYGVFSLALSMYICGFLYTFFVVKEVVKPLKENKQNTGEFLRDFFDVRHIRSTLRVAFKPRPKNERKKICIIMLLVMIIIGPMHGEMSVIYLFTRYQFQWDEINFSMYYAYYLILHIVGTIFSLAFFSKYLKLDDALLGVISSTTKVLSCFVYAFAPTSAIFCLGVVVEILNGTSFIAMRSIISKLVPPEELGKINSLYGVCEALMPLIYGPMYTLVYKHTIHVLPGTFFLVGGALTIPGVIIFSWLYVQHKREAKEEKKNEAQAQTLLKKEELVVVVGNTSINGFVVE